MNYSKKTIAVLMFLVLLNANQVSWAADNQSVISQVAEDDSLLNFENADIRDVLKLIAKEYDLNIVMSEEVKGLISLRLKQTSLVNTLDAILLARGFDYDIRDNVIRVASSAIIEQERAQRAAKQELEGLVTEVITLRYIDANDIQPTIKALLTSRGSVSVLERRPYRGFQFGGGQSSVSVPSTSGAANSFSSDSSGNSAVTSSSGTSALIRSRGADEKPRSNILLVIDVASQMEKIKKVIEKVDVAPRQVLIDAVILEVSTDSLEDLGLDFNSETTFSTGNTGQSNPLTAGLRGTVSNTAINSKVFQNALPSGTDAGLRASFSRLNGEDFNIVLHALLQDKKTKTLSSPKILTMENQEAAILVGEQFPIFESSVSDQGTTTESLSFFQPVGISLQVVAQVTDQNDVSMIIHPTVSSIGSLVTGTTGLQQPRINIREADTRVLIRNGGTLVIGGLLADTDDKKYYRIPFLQNIPGLGKIFNRRQVDTSQKNLLIFITPRVVDHLKDSLNEHEERTLSGSIDPKRYGYLTDRRQSVRELYKTARENYQRGNYDLARMQFMRVLGLQPDHMGASNYLRKMNGLPENPALG